jgi:small subunit ribosomal protein S21
VGRKAHRNSGITLYVNPNWSDQEVITKFKNKVSKSGLFRELKVRRAYEKPSEKKARKQREALRRARIAKLRIANAKKRRYNRR